MKKIILVLIIIFINSNVFSQKVIEMDYENGIYTIPCKVNGVPMTFIFDTGASDVSISLTEAKFLLKQGLLDEEDIKEKVKYKIANGKIEEGTKIIIREINIDGIILKNVEASIVHQSDAPLLLGQSAISKLGSIKLDGNKLIINSSKFQKFNFLGIDLTKSIEDLGFSLKKLSDEKEFTIANFESLKLSKSHLLKEYSFDVQQVVINKNGFIVGILLDKYTPKNISNKEKYSIHVYDSILKTLNNKFSESDKKSKNKNLWDSRNLQLSLERISNEKISLIYIVPLELIKKNKNPYRTTEEEIIAGNRETLLAFLKDILNAFTANKNKVFIRNFARFNDNTLEFHTDTKVDFIVKNKEAQYILERTSFSFFQVLLIDTRVKSLFLKSEFDYLKFKIQIKDKNYERVYTEGKISNKNFKNLRIPFSEKEFIDIIE